MEDMVRIKKFGIILTILLLILGAINMYKNNMSLAVIIWALGLLVTAAAILNPILLSPVYSSLLFASHKIGWINTRLLLIALYYTIFFPTGLIFRILRKDLLERRIEKQKNSYWIVHNEEFDHTTCEKQY